MIEGIEIKREEKLNQSFVWFCLFKQMHNMHYDSFILLNCFKTFEVFEIDW